MSEVLHIADLRRHEFRRLLVFSALAHVALCLVMLVAPGPRMAPLPGVIAVELIAAPSPATSRAPAPRRAPPALPAPPAPPVPKKVVLPKQTRLPEPKREEPAPKPKPRPPPPVEPAVPAEQEYTDVLAQLRDELGEDAPARDEPAEAVAPAAAPAGGPGVPVSPEVAAWIRKTKIHVRRAWVVPPGFRTQPLETHVLVELDAGGQVVGKPRIVRRSGNPWYDEGVVRAIQKATPLPPPPRAGEWPFVFLPEDSY